MHAKKLVVLNAIAIYLRDGMPVVTVRLKAAVLVADVEWPATLGVGACEAADAILAAMNCSAVVAEGGASRKWRCSYSGDDSGGETAVSLRRRCSSLLRFSAHSSVNL